MATIPISKLFKAFIKSEKAGGLILIACTISSLLLANSGLQHAYIQLLNQSIAEHTLTHWINDGLMTIFFLLIGLELEREIYNGELSNIKQASLPIIAALGGMLVPAGIYLLFNYGTDAQSGAGIPMATDIAFALGILSLLGKRIPLSLKIFLTALAVIDDLGAIIVIAVFYTNTLAFNYLLYAGVVFGILLICNRLKVHSIWPYIIGGVIMWYCMLHSGVHATITGVLVAFAIPFGDGNAQTLSYKLQMWLHKPVAFFVLPIFALVNTAITIKAGWYNCFTDYQQIGIITGLVMGKPIGIIFFSALGVALGICQIPADLQWKHLLGASILGGIGFTMSVFITMLAFNNPESIDSAKLGILFASALAAIMGLICLKLILSPVKPAN